MQLSGYSGHTNIKTVNVNETGVDIVGCFEKDTPVNDYEYYDLFLSVDGECINLGEPCYKYPTTDDITAFLELREVLNKA